MYLGVDKVNKLKTLKDFYEDRKKLAQGWPNLVYNFSKPKYREPLDKKEQETLNKFITQVYNSKIKKLKEAEYFRDEWMEPEINQAKA